MEKMAEREKKRSKNSITVYVDEAHFYVDADLRRKLGFIGEEVYVKSTSPGRKNIKVYGVAIPAKGKFWLHECETFNGKQSGEVLKFIRKMYPGRRIDLIWDGGPQHKGEKVNEALEETKIKEHKLPAYSPELNAIEPLWKWMREEVTYNKCHKNLADLRESLIKRIKEMQAKPREVRKRLKPNLSKIRPYLKL